MFDFTSILHLRCFFSPSFLLVLLLLLLLLFHFIIYCGKGGSRSIQEGRPISVYKGGKIVAKCFGQELQKEATKVSFSQEFVSSSHSKCSLISFYSASHQSPEWNLSSKLSKIWSSQTIGYSWPTWLRSSSCLPLGFPVRMIKKSVWWRYPL